MESELNQWNKRRLSSKNYVYMWADGIYFQALMEDDKQCMLVIIGAPPEGKKELVGFWMSIGKVPKAGVNLSLI